MTEINIKLLEQFEWRIFTGFPPGEVKAELLNRGFSEEEAGIFIDELYKLSVVKGTNRSYTWRIIISTLTMLSCIYLIIPGNNAGILFIISFSLKVVNDLIFSKIKNK